MSLATNISSLATRVGTEFKTIRTLITGSGTGTLSGLTTTDKTSVVAAINEVKAGSSGSPSDASETVKGVAELATTSETTTGTDDTRIVTPLKLAQKLSGLAAVATSGSAADLTGTLPTSVLPPLAVNETTVVADQAAMLALTAQRGDVAIRTDNSRTYILSSDSPSTLADWKQIMAAGDIVSVAGRTGVVTLTKADVGLSAVDNTSDADKPISSAAAAAYGDPTTNYVTVFETGLT